VDPELLEQLKENNRLLRGLLALSAEGLLRDQPRLGGSRFGSVEEVLSQGGLLKNVEIATILGKTPQAVGQSLQRRRNGA
jgi:hypothetical protein